MCFFLIPGYKRDGETRIHRLPEDQGGVLNEERGESVRHVIRTPCTYEYARIRTVTTLYCNYCIILRTFLNKLAHFYTCVHCF